MDINTKIKEKLKQSLILNKLSDRLVIQTLLTDDGEKHTYVILYELVLPYSYFICLLLASLWRANVSIRSDDQIRIFGEINEFWDGFIDYKSLNIFKDFDFSNEISDHRIVIKQILQMFVKSYIGKKKITKETAMLIGCDVEEQYLKSYNNPILI